MLSTTTTTTTSQTIQHIVLFKVKPDTDPSKVNAMVNAMNGLISLDSVLHLTAGPIHRIRSPLSNFTHMLHSHYASKEDLTAYSIHPTHLATIKANQPICEDIMAVDWVHDHTSNPLVPPPPGFAMRVTFFKLKEGLGEEVKDEILGVMKGIIKDGFVGISEFSCGENFSPARAKGFSIALLAVFPGVGEMEAVDAKEEELVALYKDKFKDYLDSVIVVDYVVPSKQD